MDVCGCVDVCEPVALLICGNRALLKSLRLVSWLFLMPLSLGSFRAISCCVLSTLVFSCFVFSRSLFLSFRSLVT